jgi:hypothetical protein
MSKPHIYVCVWVVMLAIYTNRSGWGPGGQQGVGLHHRADDGTGCRRASRSVPQRRLQFNTMYLEVRNFSKKERRHTPQRSAIAPPRSRVGAT